ncbi:MAG: hypothetical protein HC812_09005 [Leptolyngbya sp. RL_3_1]|nr:hypothetical protein [Leptolyngbya sp. RL_3_1]
MPVPSRPTPLLDDQFRPLNLADHYACPLCLQGQVQSLFLTEALACQRCRHIFTVDLPNQQIRVTDSPDSMGWAWTGKTWKIIRPAAQRLTQTIGWVAGLLIGLPATLVWLGGYLFPPLSSSPGELPFAVLWAGLTLVAHSVVVLWLLASYYQLPVYLGAMIRAWKYQYLS